jgi:hypothetical protein
MVEMSALNLKDLSPEQEKIVQEIWKVCKYFEVARSWSVDHSVLVEQTKNIGLAVTRFEQEENKKRKPEVPAQA